MTTRATLISFSAALAALAVCLAAPAADLGLSLAPAAFSGQDAALCLHRLSLAVDRDTARLQAYEATLDYLRDYQTRLTHKRDRLGLLPSEHEIERGNRERIARVTAEAARLRAQIAVTAKAKDVWEARADLESVVPVGPTVRLFPELRPPPSLYLPETDKANPKFNLTAELKNALKL